MAEETTPAAEQVDDAPDRLLRLPQVMDIVGLKRTAIYDLMKKDRFPHQFKPGGYSSRWSEREVRDWIESTRQQKAA